jgi:hypothetical protein
MLPGLLSITDDINTSIVLLLQDNTQSILFSCSEFITF